MPRMGRIVSADYPHHVVQRGVCCWRKLPALCERPPRAQERIWNKTICLLFDDKSCPFVSGTRQISGGTRAVNQGACRSGYSISKKVRGSYRYVMGESI